MGLGVSVLRLWRPTADCAVFADGADCHWLLFCGAEDVMSSGVTFLSAMNNQLRTGADKGNPTV